MAREGYWAQGQRGLHGAENHRDAWCMLVPIGVPEALITVA